MTVNLPLSLLVHIFLTMVVMTSLKSYAQVDVTIAIINPEQQLAQVTIALANPDKDAVDFMLPTWRTGRYQILNIADGVRKFQASGDNGLALSWRKIDKARWQVYTQGHNVIKLTYQVHANQLSYRTRHIDDSHAFIDSSAFVMYSERTRTMAHQLSLQVPEGWRSSSGLPSTKVAHQFLAINYDVLVDSPVETGVQEVHQFAVDGREYELVIWGQGNYNSGQMVNDLKAMVKQTEFIWPDYPFARYVFMVHATSGVKGATEHLNSTIIQRSRYEFHQREHYLSFLLTAAHEFVHTWNVKQYRPEGLYPYDYQQENYSRLLWVVEGSTSYLQSQLLTRSGLMTADEFLKSLAKRVAKFMRRPGRKHQTIADASFDKWIAQGGDYGKNHSVNIYDEGFLVSWMLDFKLLADSDLQRSYNDVHRRLYQEYRIPKTYNEQDLLQILEQISGKSYQSWWQENIEGFADPDFTSLLAQAGLTLSIADDDKKIPWLGIKAKQTADGVQIEKVVWDSPAAQAGLMVGDIIVAIDKLRLTSADLVKRLGDFDPEQQISMSIFRRDQLMTKQVTLGKTAKEPVKILPMPSPSKAQRALFETWTGLSFPETATQ